LELIVKFVQFKNGNDIVAGILVDGLVYALKDIDSKLPVTVKGLIEAGEDALAIIRSTDFSALSGTPESEIALIAPVHNPQKYLAIGMNYQDHADEARAAGIPIPKNQLWFNKQVSCISGPYSDIEVPWVSDKVDYEAEMVVVIGKRCRHVSVENARDVIFGYMVSNDVTVRDWQAASQTFTLGKSFDTHGPIGPWLVTDDEIEDPLNLEMSLWVNGELRQKANTGLMIHNIYEQIAHLSTVMTLEPGDLLATGTCAGVGIASNRFLKAGDVVKVEIENLGYIENNFVDEKK
jgi:2-keto-4-pentenoate hydratase/2-oxohepta-3-ene-1,7-dioic acid hydratase in catechol pathway